MTKYLLVAGTILFTVFGQIMLKWRLNNLDWQMVGGSVATMLTHYLRLLFDPVVLIVFASVFVSSACWIMAISKLELTTAYPFMSLSPAIVFCLGIFFLNETFTIGKVLGLGLIIIGTIVTVKL